MRICKGRGGLAAVACHLWGVAAFGQNSLTLFGTNSAAGKLNLCEQRTNGTNCLVLKAADGQGGTRTVTIPDVAGNWTVAGQEVSNVFTGANVFTTNTTVFRVSGSAMSMEDSGSNQQMTFVTHGTFGGYIVAYRQSGGNTYTAWRLDRASGTGARLMLNDNTTSGNAATIKAPATVTTDYALTLPAALPGSTQFLQSDTSGNLSWASGGSSEPSSAATASFTRDISLGNLSDTSLHTTASGARMYLVTAYKRCTTTGALSGGVIQVKWTEGGTARETTIGTQTTNSTDDRSHYAIPIYVDSATTIYYNTAFTTGTGTIAVKISLTRLE